LRPEYETEGRQGEKRPRVLRCPKGNSQKCSQKGLGSEKGLEKI